MLSIIQKFKSSLLLQKILWTLFIVFIYMVGRSLPITTVPLNQSILRDNNVQNALNSLASVTGGQLSSLTLFSLGLSPWMTSMILWRFLTLFSAFKGLTTVQASQRRFILTFTIAFIQAFGLTAGASFRYLDGIGSYSDLVARIISMAVLISGAFILVWLGERNSELGLGGPTVIIIVNMILIFFTNIATYIEQNNFTVQEWLLQAIFFAISVSILILITVITYRAEYRIKIKRISIISQFSEETYIPIRLNPAGGLPFMYGMTLMMLPPIILAALLDFFPDNSYLMYLTENLSLSRVPGLTIYVIILYVLTIGFAFYNYDPLEIAKSMQEGGDYIEHIRPGKPTQKFIQHKLNVMAQIGAVLVCVLGSAPLFFIAGQDDKVSLALVVNNVFIVTSLMLGFIEQVDILRNWKKYGPLL